MQIRPIEARQARAKAPNKLTALSLTDNLYGAALTFVVLGSVNVFPPRCAATS